MRLFKDAASTLKTGMCPKCHAIRNLRVSVEHHQTLNKDGTIVEMEISTAHCETCGSFVSCEDQQVEPENPWEQICDEHRTAPK